MYDWPCLASVKSGRGSLAVLRLHANGGITSRMQRMRRHSMIACSADFSIVDAKSTSVTAERRARATNQMCDDDMVAVVRGPRVLRCDMQASVAGVWAEGLRVAWWRQCWGLGERLRMFEP